MTTTAQKLKIREGLTLLTLHAPANFRKNLGALPVGARIIHSGKKFDQVHLFVLTKSQLDREIRKNLPSLQAGTVLWIYFPKGSSGIQTDLTRDTGWEVLDNYLDKLAWINLISFDETWSAFGLRVKTEMDKKKAAKPKPEREVFKYVNPLTKEVRLPDDLEAALKKNKIQAARFNALSFTHKKEYIEWVVTAKRAETREKRIKGTMERLAEMKKTIR